MKEEILKLGIEEKVVDELLKIIGKNTVPKNQFNEVNEVKKQLEQKATDYETQLSKLAKDNKGNEELQKQIKELQSQNEAKEEEYKTKFNQLKLDNALELALTKEGARNSTAVKSLLKLDLLKMDNDNLIGLSEQLTKLKETDGYLFEVKGQEPKQATPQGLAPKGANGTDNSNVDINKMTYDELCNYYNNNK
ncbi:phage scaffolding protein [uncultured Sneathia sp.]|uniref:phage scaffolding protein n=1 Tax=uncultured Sneathia sp. TaxID=278067 RepID=UPI002593962C|nr:phage scaffolding protein [uncultured Sneathia sp.]